MAVSLYHQGGNLDRQRIRQLTGQPDAGPTVDHRPPLHQWLLGWIEQDVDPKSALDSLPGVLSHLTDAWSRRVSQDVVLVHYDDLVDDLDAEMRRLASLLGISVPAETWPALVEAATFAQMRTRADSIVPDPSGILKNQAAFFRRGSSGAGAETLSSVELDRYYQRTSPMAPTDLLEWLHRRVQV
jgi:hypothetical protein